ncbi:MAG: tetratricopeptide repeat protein [Bryobacteraceae bacterium]
MTNQRVEKLKELLAQDPGNAFMRYGLAMEYANGGDLEQALAEYRNLLAAKPDYPAAYFHGGRALEGLGRIDEAREMYRRGIEVTSQLGDAHTMSELRAALDILG